MKNRKWMKILLVLLAIVIMGVVFSCQANPSGADTESETAETDGLLFDNSEVPKEEDSAELVADEVTETDDPVGTSAAEPVSVLQVCVHVCGCVKTPGVYYLPEGSRVHEAVEAAGGLTKKAADDRVNLAETVTDGQQVYIPSVDEPAETHAADPASEAETGDGKVNINTASLEELTTLPGIGTAKAKAIISYRETAGAFSDIRDIRNVSGIGEGSYEKLKDYIKV